MKMQVRRNPRQISKLFPHCDSLVAEQREVAHVYAHDKKPLSYDVTHTETYTHSSQTNTNNGAARSLVNMTVFICILFTYLVNKL